MKHRGFDKSVYRSLAVVMQMGIHMIVPIAMMCALGVWLDRKLGTSFIVVVFFFLGAVAGGQNVYRLARKIYDTPSERRRGADAGGPQPPGNVGAADKPPSPENVGTAYKPQPPGNVGAADKPPSPGNVGTAYKPQPPGNVGAADKPQPPGNGGAADKPQP